MASCSWKYFSETRCLHCQVQHILPVTVNKALIRTCTLYSSL